MIHLLTIYRARFPAIDAVAGEMNPKNSPLFAKVCAN